MFVFLNFSTLFLIGLYIFFATGDECPGDVCANPAPSVDEKGVCNCVNKKKSDRLIVDPKNILMTIWYDNDTVYDPDQWNTNMVRKACIVRSNLQSTGRFSVEFIIGAGSRVAANNGLLCKHDCEADRKEGCVAKLLNDREKFATFVCCNNNGSSDHDCAKDQGIEAKTLDDCINNKASDKLLKDNGDRRRKRQIPGCHVPEFAFNGIVDRCIKIPTDDDLWYALCNIYGHGGITIDGCPTS